MITRCHKFGDNRVEIKLDNGQALTVMVTKDGIKVLTNDYIKGIESINNVGRRIPVEYYGHPFED